MEHLHFGNMSGSCLDHAWPSISFRPARALQFRGLSQHGLKYMSTDSPVFGAIFGPFWDYI